MINFYHRFIPQAASLLLPLHDALRKPQPRQLIGWTTDMDHAFTSCKAALADATMPSHPKPNAPIALTTDASDQAVGAVLEQYVQGVWQPLAFFSKRLRPPEQKYSTFDRELLRLYLAIRHFRFFLEGRPFTAYTDHKPLVGAMSKLSDPWTARQQRHLAFISEFTTDIMHVSGKSNIVADCLSRPALNNVILDIDYDAMAKAQKEDKDSHVHSQVVNIPVPAKRFSHLLIDLVGPLPPSEGFSHLMTISDRTTRWPEAIPLNNTSTTDCARALIRHWISEGGSQFTSTLWNEISQQQGVQIHRTTAYHPQSNDLIERFHRTLKAALKARLQGPNWADELPWVLLGLRTAPKEDLGTSAAELVYGTPLCVPGEFIDPTPKPLHACAPNDPFSTCVRNLSPLPTSHHGLPSSSSVPQALRDAQFVFIRHDGHRGPLRRPYDGPFRVVASGDKTFRIMVGSREEVVSTDRLKAAHVDLTGPVTVAQPPRRGRPPLQQAEPAAEDKTPESAPPRQQPCLTRSGRAVHLPPRFR
ncbi:Pol polyprotein [Elysia marginata]|uniref:Pol polyprotein n=1 Tax=Elysia marginata TaxID=1093978 RepID=A0AAV4EMQ6_9GAST|nr:Pol polyprotein [Elysia marginata]